MKIPKKYLTNPFKISPSGNKFWVDKRNVEKVKDSINSKGDVTLLHNLDDIKTFIKSFLNIIL